ncbi:uncharacterized protein LOC127844202 [Dreissena polymorpha]|uniref:BZIP domain-containing protein n=1 Tax=Dreissena polymorpha TaxID=45954 RepID=A0A9D4IGA3_DREPO|nr:uncharacterized protein LOC127844202 [Dreissena polymorpha]KAH3772955.1 hypothetical protein DPMN_174302 [Dreissena polymorpha]
MPTAAGLETLSFNFADSLIDSTCQSPNTDGSLTFATMESPRMYEEVLPDIIVHKRDLSSSAFTFAEDTQFSDSLGQFDPTLETVVDLQELINSAIPTIASGEGPMILDNFLTQGELDLVEDNSSTGNINGDFLDISKFVPEPAQKLCMTHAGDLARNTNGRVGNSILTIKQEDLIPSCQGGLSDGFDSQICAADSQSSWSPSSSRCTTPGSPVVYECRKPGRKPSANGPIRPRKREPPKDTAEYYEKRARNNVAVRKSREKAKLRQDETETRVSQLSNENERLQKKVDLLTKELNVLKSLFINVGASLPDNFEDIISR